MTDTHYPNAPGHVAGSDTSAAAADSVADTAGNMRRQVWRLINQRGEYGTTDDELEVMLGMRHQTVSARRRELELLDAIHKTPERRKTRSGRTAAVYVAGPAVKPEPAPAVEPEWVKVGDVVIFAGAVGDVDVMYRGKIGDKACVVLPGGIQFTVDASKLRPKPAPAVEPVQMGLLR